MAADLRQQPAPILQLVAERFAIQRYDERAVRDPRPNEFDRLFRLRHPVRDIEFEEQFFPVCIRHVGRLLGYANQVYSAACNQRQRASQEDCVKDARRWCCCGDRVAGRQPSLHGDDLVVASGVAQYVAGDLFDQIGIGDLGRQQRDIAP